MVAVATDCEAWLLNDKEAAALAAPGSAALNEFVTVQPKWVALGLFAVALAGIVADKGARYAYFRRVELERQSEAASAARHAPEQPAGTAAVEQPTGAAAVIARPVDPGAAR